MPKSTPNIFERKLKSDTEAIFISSRIRLARNLKGELFSTANGPEDRRRIFDKCAGGIFALRKFSGGEFVNLQELDPEAAEFLAEANFVSPELVSGSGDRGAFISADASSCIMVNEEDHLRLQIMERGLCLESLWKKLDAIDTALSKRLEYAYDPDFGFLTACPSNTGTGMRASVMMHLPALYLAGDIDKISRGLNQLGIVARGSSGESSDPVGAFYQISNQRTLGVSELDIVKCITEICVKLAKFEQNARQKMLEDSPEEIFDKISRAWGILNSCRMITSSEAEECLSFLRLAADMGYMAAKGKSLMDDLMLDVRPAHLEKAFGKTMQPRDRDVFRAGFIKSKIAGLRAPKFPGCKKTLKKSK
ncbi:MAG: ATP--guanido phosphotransferase [Opitutales bacterium]|nr:ATP--guanido phosphotransferase [Opitutales bacterium]